ncbi:MAG: hypothetical protein IPL27_12615 [Lewinellaceae bacterium]|nr:hypothetical protein [Lewinellaceae bacterium]
MNGDNKLIRYDIVTGKKDDSYQIEEKIPAFHCWMKTGACGVRPETGEICFDPDTKSKTVFLNTSNSTHIAGRVQKSGA